MREPRVRGMGYQWRSALVEHAREGTIYIEAGVSEATKRGKNEWRVSGFSPTEPSPPRADQTDRRPRSFARGSGTKELHRGAPFRKLQLRNSAEIVRTLGRFSFSPSLHSRSCIALLRRCRLGFSPLAYAFIFTFYLNTRPRDGTLSQTRWIWSYTDHIQPRGVFGSEKDASAYPPFLWVV